MLLVADVQVQSPGLYGLCAVLRCFVSALLKTLRRCQLASAHRLSSASALIRIPWALLLLVLAVTLYPIVLDSATFSAPTHHHHLPTSPLLTSLSQFHLDYRRRHDGPPDTIRYRSGSHCFQFFASTLPASGPERLHAHPATVSQLASGVDAGLDTRQSWT